MFYLFVQNNSFGHFEVDDKICHRMYIQADDEESAVEKAEQLGCYWNGVAKGLDCPCCGDRWEPYPEEINIYRPKRAAIYSMDKSGLEDRWYNKYGDFYIKEKPLISTAATESKLFVCSGFVSFRGIQEYANFVANEYAATSPDSRIFYKDGKVVEVFRDMSDIINELEDILS